jgi:hypothetical protein
MPKKSWIQKNKPTKKEKLSTEESGSKRKKHGKAKRREPGLQHGLFSSHASLPQQTRSVVQMYIPFPIQHVSYVSYVLATLLPHGYCTIAVSVSRVFTKLVRCNKLSGEIICQLQYLMRKPFET